MAFSVFSVARSMCVFWPENHIYGPGEHGVDGRRETLMLHIFHRRHWCSDQLFLSFSSRERIGFLFICRSCLDDHLKHHINLTCYSATVMKSFWNWQIHFFSLGCWLLFLSRAEDEERRVEREISGEQLHVWAESCIPFSRILSYRIGGRCSIDFYFFVFSCVRPTECWPTSSWVQT